MVVITAYGHFSLAARVQRARADRLLASSPAASLGVIYGSLNGIQAAIRELLEIKIWDFNL